jgi:predicted nucleic acid-binding protein
VKVIVDTNIVFSAILNTKSKIGKILINSKGHFQFYSCDFLRDELYKHRTKIQKLTGLTEIEVEELEMAVIKNITFINEGIIPQKITSSVEKMLKDIDLADVPFVALTKDLNGKLWTGDKKLIDGLKSRKFTSFISTMELSFLLDEFEG